MENQTIPYQPKSVEFEIDGVSYTKKELLVTDRNVLLFKIIQLTGEAAPGLGTMDSGLDFGKMLYGVLFKYTPEQATAFIKDIIVQGLEFPNFKNMTGEQYEQHFTQYYSHQIPVIKEIWNQNFGEHIEDLKKKYSTSRLRTLINSVFGEINKAAEPKTPKDTESQDSAPPSP